MGITDAKIKHTKRTKDTFVLKRNHIGVVNNGTQTPKSDKLQISKTKSRRQLYYIQIKSILTKILALE